MIIGVSGKKQSENKEDDKENGIKVPSHIIKRPSFTIDRRIPKKPDSSFIIDRSIPKK